jgi:uncharacterized protein (DUF488 family)
MPTIYTAGYSRLREPRRLLALLDELDALVIDVRLKPWTRFEGWSRKDREALFGARYRWIEAFGNDNYAGEGVRLHDPARGLAEVGPILESRSVILLCGCADPTHCHRSTVAARLAAATGCPIVHLSGDESSHGDEPGRAGDPPPGQLPLW